VSEPLQQLVEAEGAGLLELRVQALWRVAE
jgi:hypothetical protein